MAYALIALGFVLALNASGAVNFAHGDLVVLGGATAVSFGLWTELPAPLLLPFVALALGIAGVIASRVAILPLVQRPPEATFVATIALAAVIEQALTVTMGAAARTSPSLIGGGRIEIAGIAVGRQPFAIVIVGVRGRRRARVVVGVVMTVAVTVLVDVLARRGPAAAATATHYPPAGCCPGSRWLDFGRSGSEKSKQGERSE